MFDSSPKISVDNIKVTHLVRLTPEFEKDVEKSFAYWKNNLTIHDGVTYLKIPLDSDVPNQPYIVSYAWTDTWIDHASGDPQLSLQRFYMVGQPTQYVTLYRLVDHYLKSLD